MELPSALLVKYVNEEIPGEAWPEALKGEYHKVNVRDASVVKASSAPGSSKPANSPLSARRKRSFSEWLEGSSDENLMTESGRIRSGSIAILSNRSTNSYSGGVWA
jgi:hypothetical protein